jgi:hypothetical protein
MFINKKSKGKKSRDTVPLNMDILELLKKFKTIIQRNPTTGHGERLTIWPETRR